MIEIYAGNPGDPALPIVEAAFRRSVTAGLVRRGGIDALGSISVFVNPGEPQAPFLEAALARRSKICVFGVIPEVIARLCGLEAVSCVPAGWLEAAQSAAAPARQTACSPASIVWSEQGLATASPWRTRAFARFDFGNEWNNAGYGAVLADGGPWSLAVGARLRDAAPLAVASAPGLDPIPYVTLRETETSSLLWWNRPVGPVDSGEWMVIETFLADWRCEDRPTLPVIDEIPAGYDCAITMRLDCDEDIASARELFALYQGRGLPFSLAVKTGQEQRREDIALLREVMAAGGAILSHSDSHAVDWGGSADACFAEAQKSIAWLERHLPGAEIRHAVSPFHRNPSYVPAALGKAGLSGFIGGIISRDPEALLARGGPLPGDTSGVVTHSQQCMLHGDCLLTGDDRLAIPKQAFRVARASRTLFGYLDHPLSDRYDYGWQSEARRLAVHEELLDFFLAETAGLNVLWMNEDRALNWIRAKARLILEAEGSGYRARAKAPPGLDFSARWRGRILRLSELAYG